MDLDQGMKNKLRELFWVKRGPEDDRMDDFSLVEGRPHSFIKGDGLASFYYALKAASGSLPKVDVEFVNSFEYGTLLAQAKTGRRSNVGFKDGLLYHNGRRVIIKESVPGPLSQEKEWTLNKLHTTKRGQTIPIAQMEDSHLTNILAFYGKQLHVAKQVIESKPSQMEQLMGRGRAGNDYEQALIYVKTYDDMIAPYVLEAAIRGLDAALVSFGDQYRATTGREKGPDIQKLALQLQAPEEPEVGF